MKAKNLLITGFIAIAAAFGSVVVYSVYFDYNQTIVINQNPNTPVQTVGLMDINTESVNFTHAAEKSINAVVHVKTMYKGVVYSYGDPLLDFFFGNGNAYYKPPSAGSGSGVIVSPDGYIVTNNHVINNATEIQVVLNDNRSFSASLVGSDPSTDIAVLKISEDNLPFLQYGDSDQIKIGEWVVAVGNPFNLTSTVTAGIVSAKARSINILSQQFAIESFIQTDAAVNPGNSGGALVNTNGELIGINTAIASQTGSFMGYSFAIPVNIVKKVVSDIKKYGKVQRGIIGVNIIDLNAEIAEQLGVEQINGVYVTGTSKGGAAELAGIETGDIIIALGDVKVNNVPELQEQASKYRPGDKIQVTVIRKGKTRTMNLIFKNEKGETGVIR